MSMKALISAGFATAALASASIPALAWTAFTLLGNLTGNPFDKKAQTDKMTAK